MKQQQKNPTCPIIFQFIPDYFYIGGGEYGNALFMIRFKDILKLKESEG